MWGAQVPELFVCTGAERRCRHLRPHLADLRYVGGAGAGAFCLYRRGASMQALAPAPSALALCAGRRCQSFLFVPTRSVGTGTCARTSRTCAMCGAQVPELFVCTDAE